MDATFGWGKVDLDLRLSSPVQLRGVGITFAERTLPIIHPDSLPVLHGGMRNSHTVANASLTLCGIEFSTSRSDLSLIAE